MSIRSTLIFSFLNLFAFYADDPQLIATKIYNCKKKFNGKDSKIMDDWSKYSYNIQSTENKKYHKI